MILSLLFYFIFIIILFGEFFNKFVDDILFVLLYILLIENEFFNVYIWREKNYILPFKNRWNLV